MSQAMRDKLHEINSFFGWKLMVSAVRMSDQTQGKEYHEVRTPTIPKSKMLLYRKKKKIVSVLSKRPNFFTTKAFVRAQCKRSPRLWISALLVVPTLWRLSWTLSAAVQHFVPLLHYTDKQLKNEVLLFWYSSLNKVSLFCFKWKKTRTKNSSNTP